MILSRKWLDEFVDCGDVGDRDFSEAMTLTGSKVETVEDCSGRMDKIVVGRVETIARHENSDHMWVCQVDVGGRAIQIVTGAQNVKAGDLVPVALDGSTLPGGVKIEKGVLRGVASDGMLCSLKELGLDARDFPYAVEDGIWIIEESDAAPGGDIRPLIGADDHIVEFEITPNRPDCLSVIGLAREAACTFRRPLKLHVPEVKGCGENIADHCDIEVEDPDLCPRYTARMVKNVRIAPSPRWLRERLRASGVRPINNIVDITNYVMLEYGQPMHAFDFSCVEGGRIVVRTAREGETIRTLDGKDHALATSMLCICDEHRPVCVAGVMGGANSEIVGDTARVLFESANFNGVSVRRTATALGMRTDASSRYEKGLDPMNTMKAVQRACELVELLGAGEVMDGVIDCIAADTTPRRVKLEPEKINGLLGTDVSREDMIAYLEPLGFVMDGDDIVVPSWRGDVEHFSDIAEEVARFYGYNKIPNTLLRGETTTGGYTEIQNAERRVGTVCRARGYDEIITYSFISPACYDKIHLPAESPLRASLKILNPLGEDTSIMRTTILPSMLEILTRNYNFRNAAVRLYEIGKVYLPRPDGLADEPKMIALGAYGGGVDFYELKGVVENICEALRIKDYAFRAERDDASYHPGRCAALYVNGVRAGVLGQVHPLVAAEYGVDTELYAAELSFPVLYAARGPHPEYVPLPRFPSISRDIAVLCRKEIPVAELVDCIRRGGGELLRAVRLFDVYTGAGVPEGKKSTAFSLTLRSDTGTLTDAEAEAEVKAILDRLATDLGAVIR